MFLFELLTVAAASNIQKAIGMKPALVLSIASFIAGLLLSASTLNIYISCIGFATLVGFGSGLVLILTIWPVWSYYPNHKDIVTGALTGSYALGNAGFSILVTVLANPMGELIDERGLYSDNVN